MQNEQIETPKENLGKKKRPVNIEAELSVEELRKFLSESAYSIPHVHIVILLVFFFFARLRTLLLHRSRKLSVQPHILMITFRNPNLTLFDSGANSDPRIEPEPLIVRKDFHGFVLCRDGVGIEVTEDPGNFRRMEEKGHEKISQRFSENFRV
ncbi:hypothetical protein PanWU01x14_229350 [Parasponia andersonii]|uniref:Uncharacterized protein n=1 Tax=Parasponia andersonii TaxID=3476 RepID=A0A2P5BLD0_PARAD|nr:hypothetical protein PanWU01x14_229350 [Parasponia andersonii]